MAFSETQMIRKAIRQLLTREHWRSTLANIRQSQWWPNAVLNALPSCVFQEPIKLGWGSWDSYWP